MRISPVIKPPEIPLDPHVFVPPLTPLPHQNQELPQRLRLDVTSSQTRHQITTRLAPYKRNRPSPCPPPPQTKQLAYCLTAVDSHLLSGQDIFVTHRR